MDRYSTFGARFLAGMIDGLVFLPLGIISVRYINSPDDGVALFLIWSTIGYSSYWLYTVLLHARYGQTLGKRVMGVKVLDVSESRIPTFAQAFLRDSVYIALNTFTLAYLFFLVLNGEYTANALNQSSPARIMNWVGWGWFLTEIVTMLTNDKRRALHDFIARTVVVRGA
jgi:uncharacterized RDD family membrane protein YckC